MPAESARHVTSFVCFFFFLLSTLCRHTASAATAAVPASLPANIAATIRSSPNAEWVRHLPPCFVMAVTSWGLGSQFMMLLDMAAILRVHDYKGEVYVDFSDSSYQCLPPSFLSFKAFLAGGTHMFTDTISDACTAVLTHRTANAPAAADGMGGTLTQQWRAMDIGQMAVGPIKREATHLAAALSISRKPQFDTAANLTDAQTAARKALIAPYQEQECWAVEQLWRLSPSLTAVTDYELALIDQHLRPLVAVHIRGGDKNLEYPDEYRTKYDMTTALERLRVRHPGAARNGTCVIVGDDGGILKLVVSSLRHLLHCHVIVRAEPGHSHVQEQFTALSSTARCANAMRYLVDVQLLAAADYSIGPILSNVDALASMLARCKYRRDPSTYMDVVGWPVDRMFWLDF